MDILEKYFTLTLCFLTIHFLSTFGKSISPNVEICPGASTVHLTNPTMPLEIHVREIGGFQKFEIGVKLEVFSYYGK